MIMSGNNSAELVPIYNMADPSSNSVISLNMSGITKLTPTNYLTWRLQVYTLLEAHELHHFINLVQPNPNYASWRRQDKMLYSSLISTLSPSVQPFVSRATTTRDVWLTLARIYGQPSRRNIKQIKQELRKTVKGSQTITEYMGSVMTKADHLALLGSPVGHEDLLDIIVDGLGEEYREVVEMVNGRDIPITIDELHEELLNRENENAVNTSPRETSPANAVAACTTRNPSPANTVVARTTRNPSPADAVTEFTQKETTELILVVALAAIAGCVIMALKCSNSSSSSPPPPRGRLF